jgi:Na+/H+-dicarboxylate symporter
MTKLALHYQILIAMLAGAAVGLVFNVGFSARTTSDHKLGDAVVRLQPNHDVITLTSRVEPLGSDESPTTFRQEFGGRKDLAEHYPDFDNVYGETFASEPSALELKITDRRVKIDEDLNRIRITYTRKQNGRELTNTYEASNPKTLRKDLPQWAAVYDRYGGTPSRTVASWGRWLGDLFLRLLKMITIPLIVTSLVTGVASLGDTGRLGRMFSKTLLYYLVTSLLAIVTGIAMVNLIRPGIGAVLPGTQEVVGGADESLLGVFDGLVNNMIPANPVQALAEASFLSIITFSILLGIFIILAGEKGNPLRDFFASAFNVMMKMTMFIIALAPIGVFAFMLYATASQGLQIFETLFWYMLTVFCALVVHSCVILPLIVRIVARRSPLEFARSMSPALMTAFSTASSNGTLPLTITSVENRAGVSNRVSSFVLPLGATINMDGTALYEVVAVLFIAQATPGFDMSLGAQIAVAVTALLASVGAAGIPHAGLVMMAIVLQAVGLPLEAQGVIIAVDRVLDMCRTSVNVWSDSCGCAVMDRFETADLPDE